MPHNRGLWSPCAHERGGVSFEQVSEGGWANLSVSRIRTRKGERPVLAVSCRMAHHRRIGRSTREARASERDRKACAARATSISTISTSILQDTVKYRERKTVALIAWVSYLYRAHGAPAAEVQDVYFQNSISSSNSGWPRRQRRSITPSLARRHAYRGISPGAPLCPQSVLFPVTRARNLTLHKYMRTILYLYTYYIYTKVIPKLYVSRNPSRCPDRRKHRSQPGLYTRAREG